MQMSHQTQTSLAKIKYSREKAQRPVYKLFLFQTEPSTQALPPHVQAIRHYQKEDSPPEQHSYRSGVVRVAPKYDVTAACHDLIEGKRITDGEEGRLQCDGNRLLAGALSEREEDEVQDNSEWAQDVVIHEYEPAKDNHGQE